MGAAIEGGAGMPGQRSISATGAVSMQAMLPAWFMQRMTGEPSNFGLLMATGQVIGVSRIIAVHRDDVGDLWLDAKFLDVRSPQAFGSTVLAAPSPVLELTIRVDKIMAAFELTAA